MKHKAIAFGSIAASAAFIAVFFGLAIINTPGSEAASIADFKAGNIIDDEVFYNKDAMTVEQIQAHLNRYNPTCDMWGTGPVGSGRSINGKAVPANTPRAEYAKQMLAAGKTRYHEPPYVCIQHFYENPTTHRTLFESKGKIEDGMISAAQIIYNAAQQYNINPQVLLVMLKKESYAWGDNWPLKDEYNTVMGYACPDNAACDTKYYGFYNQVMTAAWQLNKYKSDWINKTFKFNYRPGAVNNIYYSPTASCGKKQVYIENIATASLYIYTPYTPNDAALKAYPGTANCGSYGNRNFFMYFIEWFGTTRAPEKPVTPAQPTQEQPVTQEQPQQPADQAQQPAANQQTQTQTTEQTQQPATQTEQQPATTTQQQPTQQQPVTQPKPTVPTEPTINGYKSRTKIIEAWKKLGGETGKLGKAITKVDSYAPTNIVWQQFQKGLLVGNDKIGYFESSGGIRKRWRALGTETGKLGFPTGNIECWKPTNLCWQPYQKGLIVGNDKYGYWESSGKLRKYWRSHGGEAGKMGYPTSNIKTSGKTIYQKYSRGTLYYNTANGRYTWR